MKTSSVMEQVKAARKQSREEEFKAHGKSINYQKVMTSKNVYNRKKNKADDEVLPYFFYPCIVQTRRAASLSLNLPNRNPFFDRHKHHITGFNSKCLIPRCNVW